MPITKERLPRYSGDEYGRVHLQVVTRMTDSDDGSETDRYWRRVFTPDDDISSLEAELGFSPAATAALSAIITAARYPAAVARYEALKASEAT